MIPTDAFTRATAAATFAPRFFLRGCWCPPGEPAWALLTGENRLLRLAKGLPRASR